jgi:hypothetical protein
MPLSWGVETRLSVSNPASGWPGCPAKSAAAVPTAHRQVSTRLSPGPIP